MALATVGTSPFRGTAQAWATALCGTLPPTATSRCRETACSGCRGPRRTQTFGSPCRRPTPPMCWQTSCTTTWTPWATPAACPLTPRALFRCVMEAHRCHFGLCGHTIAAIGLCATRSLQSGFAASTVAVHAPRLVLNKIRDTRVSKLLQRSPTWPCSAKTGTETRRSCWMWRGVTSTAACPFPSLWWVWFDGHDTRPNAQRLRAKLTAVGHGFLVKSHPSILCPFLVIRSTTSTGSTRVCLRLVPHVRARRLGVEAEVAGPLSTLFSPLPLLHRRLVLQPHVLA